MAHDHRRDGHDHHGHDHHGHDHSGHDHSAHAHEAGQEADAELDDLDEWDSGDEWDDVADDDDDEDFAGDEVDLKEAFGLPDELPPLRLPPDAELAAAARAIPMLTELAALAAWVGADGRAV